MQDVVQHRRPGPKTWIADVIDRSPANTASGITTCATWDWRWPSRSPHDCRVEWPLCPFAVGADIAPCGLAARETR